MPDSPFIKDVPTAQALAAWRAAREAAGCPERLAAVTVPVAEAAGLVTAAPVWAVRSSPPFDAAGMDGIAVRAADTLGASETTPEWLSPGGYDVVDTGDPMPDGRDAVVMREHVHYDDAGRAELRAAVPPYQHVRSIGEDVSAGELLLPEGHRRRRARWPCTGSPSGPGTRSCWGWSGARRCSARPATRYRRRSRSTSSRYRCSPSCPARRRASGRGWRPGWPASSHRRSAWTTG